MQVEFVCPMTLGFVCAIFSVSTLLCQVSMPYDLSIVTYLGGALVLDVVSPHLPVGKKFLSFCLVCPAQN